MTLLQRFTIILLFLFAHFDCAARSMSSNVYVKTEWQENDVITSVGADALFSINHSDFAFGYSSALGVAEVSTKKGGVEHYLTWDSGIKFGYFSDLYAYAEMGFDLFEAAAFEFKDECEDDFSHHHCDAHQGSNDLDAYAGIAIGVDLKPFKLEAFTRLRQIDGDYWESQNHVFGGVMVAISF